MEKNSRHNLSVFPRSGPNLFFLLWPQKLSIFVLALFLVFCLSLPAQAAVEGFVVKAANGDYFEYCCHELRDAYALKLLGKPALLYQDYKLKERVAFFDDLGGYIDYQDALNAYARALLLREHFDLNLYIKSGAAKSAIMPASLTRVTLKEGELCRQSIVLGRAATSDEMGAAGPPAGGEAEGQEEQKDPVPVTPVPVTVLTTTPLTGEAAVTLAQAKSWATGCRAHQRFIAVAPLYWQFGSQTGIRPDALFAQAAYETGFGHFRGAVPPEYHNWAGIKVAEAKGNEPEDHEQFATPADGVRAHFNHIAAYTGLAPVGELHGRYYVVARASWAGTAKNVEDLSGRWSPSATYHERIVAMIEEMREH